MVHYWFPIFALCHLFLFPLEANSNGLSSKSDLTPIEPHLIEPGRNVSQLLENVLRQYDRRVRPFYGVKKLDVKLDMLILSLGEVSESKMDFTLDLYLGQFWTEPRLAFGLKNRTISLGGAAAERFWLPDTFFVNAIDTKIHHMLFTNKKVWVNLTDGFVMLSARLKTRNSCKLDLRKFPFDTQICHLPFESYSYEETELTYEWFSPLESDIRIYDEEMAQFTVVSAKRYLKHKVYHSSMFSGLTATITFQRRSTYYIFQVYIPCMLIVALSWVGFWIDHGSVPARVALSITTVLTISYMRGSVNENMPKVSYLKSVDYFLLGSFSFIFMTLVEYVLVLKLARKNKHDSAAKSRKSQEEEEWERKKMVINLTIGEKTYYFKNNSDAVSEIENGTSHNSLKTSVAITQLDTGEPTVRLLSNRQNGGQGAPRRKSCMEGLCKFISNKLGFSDPGVTYIDLYSRLLFPIGYASFLMVYFVIYLF